MAGTGTRHRELDIATVLVVAAVGTIVVVLTVILLQAFYYRTEDRAFQEAYAQPLLDVRRVHAEQLRVLAGEGQVPAAAPEGTMRMAIERAMEIVARDGARAWPAPAAPAPQNGAPAREGARAAPPAGAPATSR